MGTSLDWTKKRLPKQAFLHCCDLKKPPDW